MKIFSKMLGILLLAAMPLYVSAQNVTVKGNVKDAAGEPVIGAGVVQQGTSNGTVTDLDGNYQIVVPTSATLNFSSVGYVDQAVAVAGRNVINVVLAEDTELLEEVVVVGYGTVKKSDITGSVASVDREAMMKRAPQNIGQALQGAAAGVIVTQLDGSPDGNSAVRVRGVSTINGEASPLYVVDGVQVGTNANFVNPADIEKIEVLKDASATAIYGSQGANGVIMITTKHGEKGRTNVTVTADFGVQTLAYELKTLDIDTYASSIREAKGNDLLDIQNKIWDAQYDGKRNVINWQREMTRPALRQQYGVSITGGNEKTQYAASVGYLNNNGLVVNTNFQRLSARANVRSQITNFLEVGFDMNYTHSENHGSNRALGNNGNMSSLRDYAAMSPTLDYIQDNTLGNTLIHVNLVNPDGSFGTTYPDAGEGWEGNTAIYGNNYAGQMEASTRARNGSDRFMGTANVALTFLNTGKHKLELRSVGNWTYWGNNSGDMGGGRHRYNYINGVLTEMRMNGDQTYNFSLNNSSGRSWSVSTYLTYTMNLKNHNLTLMGGNEVSRSQGQWLSGSAKNFLSVDNRSISLTTDSGTKTVSGAYNADVAGISYFARLMYSYKDKYILTGTIRRDGSSNFGEGNRWGNFPSFAAAWNITKEPWMQDVDWLSNLKLRVGWGQTGNAGNMTGKGVAALSSSGQLYKYYTEGQIAGPAEFGGAGNKGVATGLQKPLVDTNLKWETNEQLNFGLDFGFLDDTITASFDYYIKTAKDLLLYQQVRPSSGFTSVYTNYGSIQNKGFDLTVTYKKQFNRDFGMSATLNASAFKNKVIQMGEPLYNSNNDSTGDGSNVGAIGADAGFHWGSHSITKEGEAIGSYNGFRVDHVYTSQAEIDADNAAAQAKGFDYYQHAETRVGDFRFKDLDGDGHVSDDISDMEILGNGFPKLNYGLNLTFNYKNWDFNAYMYGVLGQQILSYSAMKLSNIFTSDDQSTPNVLRTSYDQMYGHSNNPTLPALSWQDKNYNMRVSDAWVKKGDFLRLSTLQVGYTFNQPWLQNIKVSTARLYVSVQNLFTVSPYCQYGDPEVGQGSVIYTGLDTGRYPMPRTFMAGLSITF